MDCSVSMGLDRHFSTPAYSRSASTVLLSNARFAAVLVGIFRVVVSSFMSLWTSGEAARICRTSFTSFLAVTRVLDIVAQSWGVRLLNIEWPIWLYYKSACSSVRTPTPPLRQLNRLLHPPRDPITLLRQHHNSNDFEWPSEVSTHKVSRVRHESTLTKS